MALSSKTLIKNFGSRVIVFAPARLWLVLTLAGLLTACSATGPTTVDIIKGPVTKIHDGDSIHITPRGQKRVIIRFSAIDAPELKQAAGLASRDYLRSLLSGQSAQARCHKTDQYQRNVCTVFLGQINIGLKMIESGYAWHYTKYQNEQSARHRRQYQRAEAKAKDSRNGLWAANSPVAPWDFRNR